MSLYQFMNTYTHTFKSETARAYGVVNLELLQGVVVQETQTFGGPQLFVGRFFVLRIDCGQVGLLVFVELLRESVVDRQGLL